MCVCVYETPGAKFVYENFVDEVFQKHEVDIDHSLAVCKAQVALYSFENFVASYSPLRIFVAVYEGHYQRTHTHTH